MPLKSRQILELHCDSVCSKIFAYNANVEKPGIAGMISEAKVPVIEDMISNVLGMLITADTTLEFIAANTPDALFTPIPEEEGSNGSVS